jgi:hypothetical protein
VLGRLDENCISVAVIIQRNEISFFLDSKMLVGLESEIAVVPDEEAAGASSCSSDAEA